MRTNEAVIKEKRIQNNDHRLYTLAINEIYKYIYIYMIDYIEVTTPNNNYYET